MNIQSLAPSRAEFDRRIGALLMYLQQQKLDGAVLYDNHYIQYFTGFAFIPTERPMAFAVSARGERAMFVPRLELEHARNKTGYERVEHYVEYPHILHPSDALAHMLRDMGMTRAIGADHDGYPWIFGYRGPPLSASTGARVDHIAAFVEDLMMCKSAAELALIGESVKWGNYAHRLLQKYTRAGATETEVEARATTEATLAMNEALGSLYSASSIYGSSAVANYRGQIGRNSSIPHALGNNITFAVGDTLVTGAGAPMWGYNSELERTMFIGKPNDEQKRLFDHMLALQTLAIELLRPGLPCSDVDRAVRAYYEQHDLMKYWKHHVGHTVGLRYHEAPFLDVGDDTPIKSGMVFTVEPGLYSAEWGGFRHSDTVVVTDDGHQVMTYYPRDIESLTIPA